MKELSSQSIIDLGQIRDLKKLQGQSHFFQQIEEKYTPPECPLYFGLKPRDDYGYRLVLALCTQIFRGSTYPEESYDFVLSTLTLIAYIACAKGQEATPERYREQLHALFFRYSLENFRDLTYNIAVSLDCVGGFLPGYTIQFFEFYLQTHEANQRYIFEQTVRGLKKWLEQRETTLFDDFLIRYMLTEETYQHIRNEFLLAQRNAQTH